MTEVRSVGAQAIQGKRESMEDAHTIIPEFMGHPDKYFIGIYDGHGGGKVAEFAKNHLHQIFSHAMLTMSMSPAEALRQAFIETDARSEQVCSDFEGATAIVAYIDGKKVFVAGAGDAQAVLNRRGKAFQLSREHKADSPEEKDRMQDAGGLVVPLSDGKVGRVFLPGLRIGYAISRAIGDGSAGDIISPEPDIREIDLQAGDRQLVLACDGLWMAIDYQGAIDLIQNIDEPQQAADCLAREALLKGSTDNISVIVVQFQI